MVPAMRIEDLSPAKDLSSTSDKLAKYSGPVDWPYLQAHFEAGNLIYVEPALDLLEVGLAFARDEKSQVEAWLKAGDIVQPGELHANYWKEHATRFEATIVRPFVLIRPIADGGSDQDSG